MKRLKQTILGAHHQNDVAERNIWTVNEFARSMLIHWPETTNADLWPFAMDYAAYIYKCLPKDQNRSSPIEVFSGSKMDSTWVT